MPRRRASRFAFALGVIVLIGLGVRLATIHSDPGCQLVDFRDPGAIDPDRCVDLSDASHYFNAIRNDAEGEWFTVPRLSGEGNEPTALHPPGFAAAMSVVWRLGLRTPDGLRSVLALAGCATIALTGLLGRRVATRNGEVVGLLAAGLVALHPLAWAVDTRLMSEALFAPCALATSLLAYRYLERPGLGRATAVGLGLGVTSLFRLEALAGAIVLLVPLCLFGPAPGVGGWGERLRPRAAKAAALAAGVGLVALTVAPWAAVNHGRFHQPVLLTTTTGYGIRLANCDDTYSSGETFALQSPRCITEVNDPAVQARLGVDPPPNPDESDGNETFMTINRQFLSDNAGRAPVVALARVGRLWGLYDPLGTVDGFEPIERRGPLRTKIGMFVGLALLGLAVPGALQLRRDGVALSPLLVWPILATLLAVIDLALVRFRAAADPSLAILAAVALATLLSGRTSGPRARAPLTE